LLSDFRIFETDQFQEDLGRIFGAQEDKIVGKLERYVYPQLRQQPYFGKNIKKLKGYSPETWRYRIGNHRFFYEVDDKKKIVFMIAASLRTKSY
jgi:mRNA interferase RelE/StbE